MSNPMQKKRKLPTSSSNPGHASREKISQDAAMDLQSSSSSHPTAKGKKSGLVSVAAQEAKALAAAAALKKPESDDDEDSEQENEGDEKSSSEGEGEDEEPGDDSDTDIRDFKKRIKADRSTHRAVVTGKKGEEDEEVEVDEAGNAVEFKSDGQYRNKQRVLLFCSRGVSSRYRHLLEDFRKLLPHHKKDVKLDVGKDESLAAAVNAIAEMRSCNNTMFLECRKKSDLYLWVGKTPHGPSAKFHVMNVHTMDELKLTGNCMLGSRPLLSFDKQFDSAPHWQLLAALLTDVFNVPRGHPKTKPFIDRVMSFYIMDGRIWVRNYQIVDVGDGAALEKKLEHKGEEVTSLIEVGPRFVLCPIRIFSGSFGGPTLYQNPSYVSPNETRSSKKRAQGSKYIDRTAAKVESRTKKATLYKPRDPVDDVFK